MDIMSWIMSKLSSTFCHSKKFATVKQLLYDKNNESILEEIYLFQDRPRNLTISNNYQHLSTEHLRSLVKTKLVMEQSGTNSTLRALPMMDHIAIKNRDTIGLTGLISFYFRSSMLDLFLRSSFLN